MLNLLVEFITTMKLCINLKELFSSFQSYSNADLKICQYFRPHMKILRFEICARDICEKFVYKHSETIE